MVMIPVLRNIHKFIDRSVCSQFRKFTGFALTYKECGDPVKVLEVSEFFVDDNLAPNQVLVKVLAAPVNPADINMVQGKYAIKPKLPAIGGNEGVGEIVKIGSSVTNVSVGDHVIPLHAGLGTWRTHAVCSDDHFIKIDKALPLISAATISVNPCTAYRMLSDFGGLKEGDTVIQNGANSGVGQAVIQIAKCRNINTINVIRDRPNLEELKNHLMSLGATYVITETDLRGPCMTEMFKKIEKPKLAFNCVGGKSAAELVRHLQNHGTIVTYGGMSKLPLTISTASLIFNDIRYVGFWMTRWSSVKPVEERNAMLDDISSMIKGGHLKPPLFREIKFKDYKNAIEKSMEPLTTEKQLLVMTD